MNDLSWRARRAAARWLFVGRRMELVAEEVELPVEALRVMSEPPDPDYGVRLQDVVSSRNADAIGLTRPREGRARELRLVEVKVSRDDLRSGLRKQQIGNGAGGLGSVADFCHLLIAKGVKLDFGELPPRWGVLEWDPDNPKWIRIAKPARRLAPTVAVDLDRLAHVIVQASLWRLYSYNTAITYTREYERTDEGWRLERKEIQA